MRGKVSKRMVDALRPRSVDVFLWDAAQPGFGLRVMPSGVKSYVFRYRLHGRRWQVVIGLHGAPWTPEKARGEARILAGRVESGGNPAAERRESRKVLTVRELMVLFLTEHAEAKRAPSTAAEYRRIAEKLILPQLGRLRLDALTRDDVARLHHGMRGTPYQANRVLAVLSKAMNWAERHGLRPDGSNPCRHVERFPEHGRERFLSEAELARLGDVLAETDARDLASPTVTAALRLLIFTGARLGEILTLQWDMVDLDRATLRLPTSKTGAKTIYLNPPAMAVLAALPKLDGNPYVLLGGKAGGHLVNLQKPWREIRSRADLDDVRLHDLRHSYASIAAGLGQSLTMIGKLLGHTQAQTTQRYAHLAADPVHQAADAVGKRIADAMRGPRDAAKPSRVVPLER